MTQRNAQLAGQLQQIAQLLQITGANRFRVVAYDRAARAIEAMDIDAASLDREALLAVDGLGKAMVDHIRAFAESGRIPELDALLGEVPAGLLELLDVPGLGPKTVAQFWKELDVTSVAQLKEAIAEGKLDALSGFGPKKLENLNKSLAILDQARERRRIGQVMPLATAIVRHLSTLKGVEQAAYAGSLRRGCETIGDLDILVAAAAKDAPAISNAFVAFFNGADIIAQGESKTSVRLPDALAVDLRIVAPESFGAALMYFTGSKEHNVRLRQRAIDMGLRLNEYGLYAVDATDAAPVASASEAEIYKALKLATIAPELREDHGEIALAQQSTLPQLVTLGDIRAELHAHTDASDGSWTMQELIEAAIARGFHTLAITDHSRSQVQANGLSPQRLEKQIETVRELAGRYKGQITLLAGSEVDILTDGSLDYPDSLLAELDLVVASPHAALTQDPDKATHRLLKAIENPYVTILGHPTGRIVNRREGLSPDMAVLCKAAAARGIAMEINSNFYRLDLRDRHARTALEAGVQLAINTDAHGPADLDQLIYGILTARRAGAQPSQIVNCLSAEKLHTWIRSTRA